MGKYKFKNALGNVIELKSGAELIAELDEIKKVTTKVLYT